MGNHMCLGANAVVHQVQDSEWALPPVKVVMPDGGIQAFKRAVKVSELVKLHPDHFLCHSKSLITTLTQKAVLPKDMELEAGRLYYILPITKLLQATEQLELQKLPKKPAAAENHHVDHLDVLDNQAVIRSRRRNAPAAARNSDQLPFEIKLLDHTKSRQQQQNLMAMPGFAQVTVLRAGGAGVAADGSTPIISYSTPDLRSMYLMSNGLGAGSGGGGGSGMKKVTPVSMLTRSNSWKPRLETISEVGAYSRRRIQKLVNLRSDISRARASKAAAAGAP